MKSPYTLLASDQELLLESELLHECAVYALVGSLEVFEMLPAVGDEPQESAARVFILAVFVQMSREFLDPTSQNGDLYFGRASVLLVTARFLNLILLFALRKHCQNDITFRQSAQGFPCS